jgi:CxxC motif-containing protein
MKKEIVCFICPNSCVMTITGDGTNLHIKNNRCPRGIEFARTELSDPERTLTSTVRVVNGVLPLVSVRSDRAVKKTELKELIRRLDAVTVNAPVQSGQVIAREIGGNKVNIIATRGVESK